MNRDHTLFRRAISNAVRCFVASFVVLFIRLALAQASAAENADPNIETRIEQYLKPPSYSFDNDTGVTQKAAPPKRTLRHKRTKRRHQ